MCRTEQIQINNLLYFHTTTFQRRPKKSCPDERKHKTRKSYLMMRLLLL
jgi:hypothetical protein